MSCTCSFYTFVSFFNEGYVNQIKLSYNYQFRLFTFSVFNLIGIQNEVFYSLTNLELRNLLKNNEDIMSDFISKYTFEKGILINNISTHSNSVLMNIEIENVDINNVELPNTINHVNLSPLNLSNNALPVLEHERSFGFSSVSLSDSEPLQITTSNDSLYDPPVNVQLNSQNLSNDSNTSEASGLICLIFF